jgi:hypothetical protein
VIFTCRKILRHGADGFTPPKESVLQIFIALKNPSPSARSEPANLGSYDEHVNHYITEATIKEITTDVWEECLKTAYGSCYIILTEARNMPPTKCSD